jgi:hypothetical protein
VGVGNKVSVGEGTTVAINVGGTGVGDAVTENGVKVRSEMFDPAASEHLTNRSGIRIHKRKSLNID